MPGGTPPVPPASASASSSSSAAGQYGVGMATSGFCDLGTAASPGGNTFDNAVSNVSIAGQAQRVLAVGNAWKANAQGADAQGRYAVPAGLTALDVSGPASGTTAGPHYRLGAGTSLRLAGQQPHGAGAQRPGASRSRPDAPASSRPLRCTGWRASVASSALRSDRDPSAG